MDSAGLAGKSRLYQTQEALAQALTSL